MAYTNIDDPSAYFQTATYTGGGGGSSVTNDGNSNLKPDLVWFATREGNNKPLIDSSRGGNRFIYSDLTQGADVNTDGVGIATFDTDGFTFGSTTHIYFNNTSKTYVAWQWKANGGTTTSVSASGTGSGCVNASTHQTDTTAGFSIITYTGRDDQLNNGQHSLLKHGLGVVPTFIILKRRDATADWYVMGKKVTSASAYSNNEYLSLNDTDGINGNSYTGSVAPTSTDIYLGNELVNVASATYVMYAFAEKQGYSKFGSYVGNGNANGPFVYTGFKPAFLLVKAATTAGQNWLVQDSKRPAYNPTSGRLFANTSGAENTDTELPDFLSNGFKVRSTSYGTNKSGETYIYMAFAENPFTTSTGIPTTAR